MPCKITLLSLSEMSKVSNPIHAVINTYRRRMTINSQNREVLYRFIWRLLQERDCKLYRIGGVEDHVHILFDLNPNHALKDKKESSRWMKQCGMFPDFEKWGKEYFAFARSREGIQSTIEYIKLQPEHHRSVSFDDEMASICRSVGIEWKDWLLS